MRRKEPDEFLAWCIEFLKLHGEPPDEIDVWEEWGLGLTMPAGELRIYGILASLTVEVLP